MEVLWFASPSAGGPPASIETRWQRTFTVDGTIDDVEGFGSRVKKKDDGNVKI